MISGFDIYRNAFANMDEGLKEIAKEHLYHPKHHPECVCHTGQRKVVKIGRNEPCPCGSGKKYKRCCIDKVEQRRHA